MPEARFNILTTPSQQPHLARITAFLSEHEIADVQIQALAGGLVEVSAESPLELPIGELVALWRSVLGEADWYRLFESDEGGSETFCYVDRTDAWRICTDQVAPDATTLEAYRRWHDGLGNLTYGTVEESDLIRLEEKFGQFDTRGQSVPSPSPPLRERVGSSDAFVGLGVQVPHAGKHWDWFIPDLDCLAVRIAAALPDAGPARFRRTYIIDGNPGYLWSWQHDGLEVCLVFMFFGESTRSQRLIRNHGGATWDELILAAYYEEELEQGFDRPEPWIQAQEDPTLWHEPLQSLEAGPFNITEPSNIFEGRVISAYHAVLLRRKDRYYLAQSHNDPASAWLEIPATGLDDAIRRQAGAVYGQLEAGVPCQPKLVMRNHAEIAALSGARFLGTNAHGEQVVIGELRVEG